jgi:hypothetical protein
MTECTALIIATPVLYTPVLIVACTHAHDVRVLHPVLTKTENNSRTTQNLLSESGGSVCMFHVRICHTAVGLLPYDGSTPYDVC